MLEARNSRARVAAVVVAMSLPLFAGCATKGYVNDRVGEMGARMDQENGSIRGELERNGRTAGDALARADAARSMALGRVDYVTVEEHTVNFPFDSAELSGDATSTLDGVLQTVASNPAYAVEILGHADTTGPDAYNDALSMRRASAVLRYLLQNGPGPVGRYASVGFGETAPIFSGGEEDRKASRRVVVSVLERREPGEGGDEDSPVISRVEDGESDW